MDTQQNTPWGASCSKYALINKLFITSRGADLRVKIVFKLRDKPMNINQLAKELNVDYKTIKFHLTLLKKYNIVNNTGDKYGSVYYLVDEFYNHWNEFINMLKVNKGSFND